MVRMGRTPKGWAQNAATTSQNKPKYSSATLQPGRVTTNVVASIYGPRLIEKATEISEQYASRLLDWEDDDAANNPRPKQPKLFATEKSLEELADLIRSTSRSMSGSGSWRARVNAAKFERQLDEKYGFLRPLLTHPTVEAWAKWAQRKHALGHFSLVRTTPPPLSTHNSLILLFMLQRNKVRTDALVLIALFLLVGLQPWVLVCFVTYAVYWKEQRIRELPRNSKLRTHKDCKLVPSYYSKDDNKQRYLRQAVGAPLSDTNPEETTMLDSSYDAIILGSGIDTLYCAALLSRMGYRTLCLCPTEDASGCLMTAYNNTNNIKDGDWTDIPFDVNDNKVGKIQVTQKMLAPALCSTTDAQGGVRFASIGTEADGFAYDIVSVPGMGYGASSSSDDDDADTGNNTNQGGKKNITNSVPFVLRAGGISSIAQDAAIFLGDGWMEEKGNVDPTTSSIAQYMQMCVALSADTKEYYCPKMLLNEQQAAWATLLSGGKWSSTAYGSAAVRQAGDFLKRFLPLNSHVRSLAAAIGCRNEDVSPSQTSMAVHISNIAAAADPTGFAYPVGGPRSIGHALKNVVEALGEGKVVTGVTVQEFILAEEEEAKDNTKQAMPPRCVGVKLADGTALRLRKDRETGECNGVVISFLGVVPTCIRIPASSRSKHGIPAGVPVLRERRPLIHILYGLNGSSFDLNLPAADWWRLPSCSLPQEVIDAMTEPSSPGNGGKNNDVASVAVSEDIKMGQAPSEVEQQVSETTVSFSLDHSNRGAKNTTNKFQTGKSWMRISFPSAKDPSWNERHPDKSTCVVTIEADDEFCRMISGKPSFAMMAKPSSGEIQRLKDRVMRDLLDKFPQLEGKIAFQELRGPYHAGLSQSAEKFAVTGVRPETPYPGLYLGGKDLVVDSFCGSITGAWLAVNAVMGYTVVDTVLLEKNVTADLEQFLPSLKVSEDDDVAVKFKPRAPSTFSDKNPQPSKKVDCTAEDSKES